MYKHGDSFHIQTVKEITITSKTEQKQQPFYT